MNDIVYAFLFLFFEAAVIGALFWSYDRYRTRLVERQAEDARLRRAVDSHGHSIMILNQEVKNLMAQHEQFTASLTEAITLLREPPAQTDPDGYVIYKRLRRNYHLDPPR